MNAPVPILAICTAAALALPAHAQDEGWVAAPTTQPATTQPATKLPAALRVLVPDNSVMVGVTQSLADLERVAVDLTLEIAPDASAMVSVDQLFSELLPPGFDSDAIDRSLPLGFALGPISMQAEPQAFILIPTQDPDSIKALLPTEGEFYSTRSSGGYIGITRGLEYPKGTGKCALLDSVPDGLLGISIDIETIIESFGPMIEFALQMVRMKISDALTETPEAAAGFDFPTIMETYFQVFQGALDSVETLNLSLSANETLLDFRWQTVVAEGSPMASIAGPKPTAAPESMLRLADDSMAIVLSADNKDLMNKTSDFFKAIFSAYPDPMSEGLSQSFDSWNETYGMFGNSFAVSGRLSDSGMRFAMYFDGTQFDELLTKYEEIVREPFWGTIGMRYVDTKKAMIGDSSMTRFTFDFEFAAMLAPFDVSLDTELEERKQEIEELEAIMKAVYGEQMILTLARAGDLGVLTVGGDDAYLQKAITRAGKPGRLSFDMEHLLDLAATTSPFLAYRFDVGQILAQTKPLLESQLGPISSNLNEFENISLPLNQYLGITPRTWTGGILVDLIQASELMQAFQLLENM